MHKDPTSSSGGSVTFMGSGEMTDPMSKVYRTVMSKIAGPVKAVFLDTPAGFQLNADEISSRAVAYFQQHFDLPLEVASFKSKDAASIGETEQARSKIQKANLIFAGPGSPTYAAKNWKGTSVFEEVQDRLAEGAHLIFASAAAIAMGRYTLPVYEIYKVGEDPRWAEGIDLLTPYGLEDLAVMPHWNNAEGGTHDTRFTFMGEPRFRILEAQLPSSAIILGIDEYTAAVLDLARAECTVMGAGQVTLRRKDAEQLYPARTSFSLQELRPLSLGAGIREASSPEGPPREPSRSAQQLQERIRKIEAVFGPSAGKDWDRIAAMGYLLDLAKAIDRAQQVGVEEALISQANEEMRQALSRWGVRLDSSRTDNLSDISPLVGLLSSIRNKLREAKQWALADEIRNALASHGIILEDTPDGTRWHKSP
jgi:cyanophycinase-like exopeptidase